MSAWLVRHLQTMIGSLGRLSQHTLATLLTTLVIAIALALPACLHLLVTNAQSATGDWNRAVEISVYLKRPTSIEEAQKIADRLQQRRDVAAVDLVPAEAALKEFRRSSGFGDAMEALKENPLPHTLVVHPKAEFATAEHLESLANDIRQFPSTDIVQLDTAWVTRLHAILDAVRRAVLLAAGLLGLGVVVIVGNTIRLDIQNRRAEIEVTKLVGGSDAFVRRPFLYSGMWYGLGGAILAWVLSAVVVGLLRGPVNRIAGLYGSDFEIRGLGLEPSLMLLAAGVVLGWIGSFIAASRHLREIEPS